MSSPPDVDLNVRHFVYRCFDGEDQLLYVGVARNVDDRMFHHLHACNSGKQPNGTLRRHLSRYDVEEFPTKVAAREGERIAIRDGAPLLNKQHNFRRFRRVDKIRYGLVEPVHPLTAMAFPDAPRISQDVAA